LLKPEEVMALPERIAISFMPGVPPIRTWLVRYYERDFRRGGIGRGLFGKLSATAAILFMALMLLLGIASAAAERNNRHRDTTVNPFLGFDQKPIKGR